MTNTFTIFFLKYLLFSPILGFSTIYGVVGFSKAFNFSTKSMIKWKVGLLFTFFYISIYVFYKNGLLLSPRNEALREIVSSILLGTIWAWVFVELIDAIGYKFKEVKKIYLACLLSIIAFGIFTLIK